MTVEERAELVAEDLYDEMVVMTGGRTFTANAVAKAIREAVAEEHDNMERAALTALAAERERCAQLVEANLADSNPYRLSPDILRVDIVKAIREGK